MASGTMSIPLGLKIRDTYTALNSGDVTFHNVQAGSIVVFSRNGKAVIFCSVNNTYTMLTQEAGITVTTYTTGGDLVVNRANTYTGTAIILSP